MHRLTGRIIRLFIRHPDMASRISSRISGYKKGRISGKYAVRRPHTFLYWKGECAVAYSCFLRGTKNEFVKCVKMSLKREKKIAGYLASGPISDPVSGKISIRCIPEYNNKNKTYRARCLPWRSSVCWWRVLSLHSASAYYHNLAFTTHGNFPRLRKPSSSCL